MVVNGAAQVEASQIQQRQVQQLRIMDAEGWFVIVLLNRVGTSTA